MIKFRADFLINNRMGCKIPKIWIDYVCQLSDKKLWQHIYLWTAFQVLELLKDSNLEGKKILEPGCGSGIVGCLFALMGAEVTLLDYSQEVLSVAKTHAKNLKVENKIKFVKADLFNIPLEKESYDLVWNGGTIEHFERPEEGIVKMKEMAKTGGEVVVLVPSKWTLHTLFVRPWRRKKKNFGFDKWGKEKSFSERALRKFLVKAELKEIKTSTRNLRRSFLDDYFILPCLQRKISRKLSCSLFQGFDALEKNIPFLSKLGFMAGARGVR